MFLEAFKLHSSIRRYFLSRSHIECLLRRSIAEIEGIKCIFRPDGWLFANLAAMHDSDHCNDENIVQNLIDYPVITNANPPSISFACQFLAAARSGVLLQPGNARQNSPPDNRGQLSEFLGGRGGKFNAVSAHSSSSARSSSRLMRSPSSTDFAAR